MNSDRDASVVQEVGKSIDSLHMGEYSADFSQAPPPRQGNLIHVVTIVLNGTATVFSFCAYLQNCLRSGAQLNFNII